MSTITCSCGKLLKVPPELAGKMIRCPGCKAIVRAAVTPVAAPVASVPIAVPAQTAGPTVTVAIPVSPPVPKTPPKVEAAFDGSFVDEPGSLEFDDSADTEFGPPQAKFFGIPSPAIGPVKRCYTSMGRTSRGESMSRSTKMLVVVAIGVVLAAGVGLGAATKDAGAGVFIAGVVFLATVFIGSSVVKELNRDWYCGYVGEHGAAYFEASIKPENVTRAEEIVFAATGEVYTNVVHEHNAQGFVYERTKFQYSWYDDDGHEVMTIAGADTDHHRPGRWQRRAFANAVELAFSLAKLKSVAPQIRAGGSFEFALPADESMFFEKNSIRYRTRRGTEVTLSRDDLACVAIANRVIKLREFGSREGWFTSSGVHSIQLDQMTNVRLFLLLINELYDVPVTGS